MTPVIGLDITKGESQVHAFLQRKKTYKQNFKFEPVLQFLEDHNITYYLINPVVSYEAKKTNLRKVKTDKIDAFHLGEYYKEDLKASQKKTEQYMNLGQLTRQHSALTDSYVEIKLQFQAALDHIFPEYHGVFSDLCGNLSLNTLLQSPTSSDIQNASQQTLAAEMRQFGEKRSYTWFLDKAAQLKDAADRNPFQHPICRGHIISLQMYIQMLFQYQKHLS